MSGTTQPRDLDTAVSALLALNGDDKPYELTVDRGAGASGPAVVTASWKVADVKWAGVLGGGRYEFAYRLEVTLDGTTGTYRFVEREASTQASAGASATGVHAHAEKKAFRGKTFGQHSSTVVVSRRVKSTDKDGETTEGHVWKNSFKPTDVKEPVFDTLRGLGWRPPRDSWWSRVWER
jgi:hypothetical protein